MTDTANTNLTATRFTQGEAAAIAFNLCSLHGFPPEVVCERRSFAEAVVDEYLRYHNIPRTTVERYSKAEVVDWAETARGVVKTWTQDLGNIVSGIETALNQAYQAGLVAGDRHQYQVGPKTMANVFQAAGLKSMSNMQAVLDAVEKALEDRPDAKALPEDAAVPEAKPFDAEAMAYEWVQRWNYGSSDLKLIDVVTGAIQAAYAQCQKDALTDGLKDIAAERRRQIEDEGWMPEDDDEHTNQELAKAASAYAWPVYLSNSPAVREDMPLQFPDEWDLDWWKPSVRRRDLVKAGALIIAEIERIDRAMIAAAGAK